MPLSLEGINVYYRKEKEKILKVYKSSHKLYKL